MRKQTKESNTRKAFLKILRPPCLGKWNCLVTPNPNNLYYKPDSPLSSFPMNYTDLAENCPFIVECMEEAGLKDPKKELKEWLSSDKYRELIEEDEAGKERS